MKEIDFRRLRHFVAVAEELHFGRAAVHMRMAQPALSLSIKHLERSIGANLFERSRRAVKLTPAGTALLQRVPRILADVEQTRRAVLQAASQIPQSLKLGFASAALLDVLPTAIPRFKRKWPAVEINLEEGVATSQIEAVRLGQLDLALHMRLAQTDIRDLQNVRVKRFGIVAVVPSSSPLAKRKSLRLPELADQSFVLFHRNSDPDLYSKLIDACHRAGFAPRVDVTAHSVYSTFALVARGFGVSITVDMPETMAVRGVRLVPVIEFDSEVYQDLTMWWRPATATPALLDLITIIKNVGAKRGLRQGDGLTH